MSPPIGIKLRCASWGQLASIYQRDLARSAIFLRSSNPPPIGTAVRIDLTLPSESMVVLTGAIARHVQGHEGDPGLAGRGAGVDVRLDPIAQSAMWLIETALASAKDRGKAPAREPSLAEGADHATAETELLVALTSELDSLRRLDPFQVLGVGHDAGDADIRAAFGQLTRRYHPDRYTRYQSTELREIAAEIFILVRDSYRRLGDEAGRAQQRAQLHRGHHARLGRVDIELAEGLRALAKHDRLAAARHFEAVLELDPANERAARELAEMRRLATSERKGTLSRLLGKKE